MDSNKNIYNSSFRSHTAIATEPQVTASSLISNTLKYHPSVGYIYSSGGFSDGEIDYDDDGGIIVLP